MMMTKRKIGLAPAKAPQKTKQHYYMAENQMVENFFQSLLGRLRKSRVDGATPKDSSTEMPYAQRKITRMSTAGL